MKEKHCPNRLTSRFSLHACLHQPLMLVTCSGAVITGRYTGRTAKKLRLHDARILLSNGDALLLEVLHIRIAVISMWGKPDSKPPPICEEQVVTGKITDSVTNQPVVGALVRVVQMRDEQLLRVLGYAYSGCGGWYMLSFSRALLLPGDRIAIQTIGPASNDRLPALCKPPVQQQKQTIAADTAISG